MTMYKVTYLIDAKNNWIESYLLTSKLIKSNSRFKFTISHNPLDVKDQDLVFILGYTKILKKDFLKSNKMNLVVHESDVPKGKGFSPVQWQILEGAKSIPVCLIEADINVDSGDILAKDKFDLSGHELYGEIRRKQAFATIKIIDNFLKNYPNYSRMKQIGKETFYPKRTIEDGELDINKSIKSQFNLLRIGNNDAWPSFFYHKKKKYYLKIFPETINE
jgi:methionyl-tRNA formyltransferase